MTVSCETISVTAPSNITATNMILDKNYCEPSCNVIVTITWENTGGKKGTFEPAIIVNGIRTGLGSTIDLNKKETTIQTFNLTGLVEGSYTVCPDPN